MDVRQQDQRAGISASGVGPEEVSPEAQRERSYLWMSRVFGLVSMAALIANLILIVAVFSLLPIVRVQPFYVSTQDKDQQIITIQRPAPEVLSSKELQESFVRQYLVARLGIGSDVNELERRWGNDGLVQWMSGEAVFNEFLRTAPALVAQAQQEGLTRNVRILNASTYPVQGGGIVWQAEVELVDMKLDMKELVKTKWAVLLEIRFGQLREGLRWDQRLKNPLGFSVVRFSMRALDGEGADGA